MVDYPRRSGSLPQRAAMFEAWTARFPNEDSRVTQCLQRLTKAYSELEAQVRMISADTLHTPAARLVKSAKWARAKLNPLFDELKAAREGAAAHSAQLEEKVKAAYSPRDNKYEQVIIRQEIRNLVRAMPMAEKQRFLDAAVEAGDLDPLYAVCAYGPELSGLMPDLHKMYRATLIMKNEPHASAQLLQLQQQDTLAANFERTMIASVGDMIDFARADDLLAASSENLADQYAS